MTQYLLFADESENKDFYTVAGYVAPISVWANFSVQWFAILKESPRLGFYRTSDSLILKKQFRDWSREARDARVMRLARTIPEKYVYGVAAHVLKRDFQELFAPNFRPEYSNPYYLCADYLVPNVCQLVGGEAKRIDFIFDRQGKIGQRFEVAYKSLLKPAYSARFSCVGDVHFWKKDRVPPLQAADMHAAWVRRRESAVQIPLPEDCYLARIPQADFQVTRNFLERLAQYRHEHDADIRAFSDSIDRGDFSAAKSIVDAIAGR
jgi:Protein of unknown function (DUF3800)